MEGGGGVTKTMLNRKVANSEPILNVTNDVVQQIQEKMQKMEKQMKEQKTTIRQEGIADVIAQLQQAGLIDPNLLVTMSVPSPRETTSAQVVDQGNESEEGDESSSEDLT